MRLSLSFLQNPLQGGHKDESFDNWGRPVRGYTRTTEGQGSKKIIHWDGRSKAQRKWVIPDNLTEAIIFYDYVAHSLMHQVKKELKQRKVPITFARRGQSCLAALKLNTKRICEEAV